MRKIIYTLPILVVFLGFAPAAQAQLYAGGYGGLNIGHDGDARAGNNPGLFTMDFGFGFGAFIGGYVNPNVRVEGEVAYRLNDLESFDGSLIGGDISSLAFMANAYYDIQAQSAVTPYIGGGLGFADVDMGGFRNGDDTVFAMQLMLGGAIAVSPDVSLTVEYRLFGTEDPTIGNFNFEYLNSSILGGIRATF